ncbi:MAG: glycosyltransferase [Chloroflexi bacterium]|nr:glycosyltransferase [Chloroflexota bacterium]
MSRIYLSTQTDSPEKNTSEDENSPGAMGQAQEKPKILVLTQVLPFPPDAGPKIKTFNLIKYLARDYAITLVSFVRPENTPEHLAKFLEYCEEVHYVTIRRSRWRDGLALLRSFFSTKPFLIVRDESRQMTRLLKELVTKKEFALVHADQLNMAQYGLPLPVKNHLLDQHNAVWKIIDRLSKGETNPFKKALMKFETFKLRRYEQQICRRFEVVLAVNRQDAEALKVACEVIPIGVDAVGTEPLALQPGSLNLVSLGTMFYPPNVEGVIWFATQVLPLIQEARPEVTYTIIGPRPPDIIYDLARRNSCIRVTGYLADLRPTLEASCGLVVPLLSGGGMRVKILEALSLGLPVISTTIGAESINLENEKTGLLADTPQEFAQSCLKLLNEPDLQVTLSNAGRQLALEQYDFRKAYAPLTKIYSNLIPQ